LWWEGGGICLVVNEIAGEGATSGRREETIK